MKPEEQKEIVRRGYDRLSYAYRGDDTPETYSEYSRWSRTLIELVPRGASLLDIGCGCGLPATKILAEHFDVTGVDISEVQIERARRLVPNARFVCGDIAALALPVSSFDVIVSFYAIIHIPLSEHQELFRRVASWLRPSGYFMATLGQFEWTGEEESYLGIADGRMCWSHADGPTNESWIEEAGLRVLRTEFVPEGSSGHLLVLAQNPPIDARQINAGGRP